jgi:hypothetical protein
MNTVCFIGVFQFLGTYISTRDPWALGVFVNGVIYHGGCKVWKWPDIIFNIITGLHCLWIHWNFFTTMCFITGSVVYTLNNGNNIIHVLGVQYLGNISLLQNRNQELIPPCLLLGTLISCIINGASRLETGCVEASRGTDTEASVPKPPTEGEGHPRGRSRRSYYIPTEVRAPRGTGFSEAARPFLRGTASRLSGQGKGHGRSRSWSVHPQGWETSCASVSEGHRC